MNIFRYVASMREKRLLWHLLPLPVKCVLAVYEGGPGKIPLRRLARLVALHCQIPMVRR
jgi:tetraacyldisaccharide-1-P 4'-kinase